MRLPFVTLLKEDYPIFKVQKEMSSYDVCRISYESTYSLGILWFDTLEELLKYSDYKVYLLEDVYLRFKSVFDICLQNNALYNKRVFVIADEIIPYWEYECSS